jgi:hypothetical protein
MRKKYRQVEFKNIAPNLIVPMQPWPIKFIVSDYFIETAQIEVRPLTLRNAAVTIIKTETSYMFWNIARKLFKWGFLKTPEGEMVQWKHLTWRFWENKKNGKQ